MATIGSATKLPSQATGGGNIDPQLQAMVQSMPADQQKAALQQLQAMTPAQQKTLLQEVSAKVSAQQQAQPGASAGTGTGAAGAAAAGAETAQPPSTASTVIKSALLMGAAGAALGFGASFFTLPVIGQVSAPIAAAVGGGIGVLAGIVTGLFKAKKNQADYEAKVAAQEQAKAQAGAAAQPGAQEQAGDAAAPVPAPVRVTRSRARARGAYAVVPGDSLSRIARKYRTTWQKLYEANREAIGPNPNLIHPGLKLRIPGR